MKKHLKLNKFIKNNSPTILTTVGVIGVGATAVMSARDTVKAYKRVVFAQSLGLLEEPHDDTLTIKEKIKLIAPCYIPTILTGLSTILCICGANKLNKNIQKSLTSAYIMLDQTYRTYRDSVRETYGAEGEMEVVKHVADKQVVTTPIAKQDDTDVFFDFYSLRFFNSKLSTIQEVENTANKILQSEGYISVNDVYAMLGEDTIETDDMYGWSLGACDAYGYNGIKIVTHEMAREDGSKYYVLDFENAPTEDYRSCF